MVDPKTQSNPNGLNLQTSWTYDSANNVLTATDATGVVTQYTYDTPATGNLVKKVANSVSGGASDSQTNVTTTYTYDSYGEPVSKTDPLGVVTAYTYDSQGDLLTTTANDKPGVPADSQTNVVTSATYDTLSQAVTATDALGVVSQTVYDIRGNVMQTVQNYVTGGPTDSQTNVTTKDGYDALGRPVSVTDPKGIVTETVYDADGRTVKSIADYVNGGPTDSQTNVTTTTAYDAAGNATQTTQPGGNTTTTAFDVDNRAIEATAKSSSGATMQDTQTTYDADGHTCSSTVVTGTSSPPTSAQTCSGTVSGGTNNPTTNYTYDAAGRTASQAAPPANPGATDASGQSNVTTFTHDKDGNVTDSQVTNSAVTTTGHLVSETTAVYDKLARPTSKTEQAQAGSGSSAAQTTSYTYDKDGQQATQTDASGTTSVQRDALERVTTQTPPAGSAITYGYDAAGHTLVNSNGVTTTVTTYDPLWRVSTEKQEDASTGAVEQTTSYAYDANGNPLNPITTYANGTQSGVTYTYDKLGRIATMSDGTRNYTYDGNGNLSSMQVLGTSGTPVVEEDFSYDGANRPAGLTDKVGTGGAALHTYTYSYTQAGNAGSITTDGVTTSYTFDTANELTQTTTGSATTSYTYDANHNRTSMVTTTGTTSYGYDSSDTELTSKTDPRGKVTSYAYDSSGNLATATYDPTGANQQTAYHYDTTGRLSEIDKPDGSKVQYTYDADGNRTSTTNVSGGPVPTQTMVRDVYQAGRIAYETDGAGTTLATFSYDPNGTPTSVVLGTDPTNGPRYYYVYNGHGDVVALTDTSGNVVASYRYDEFGNLASSTESFPNDPEGWTNPYRYDGQDRVRYDTQTGLYWMSVRAYDPTLGRFISRDPLGRQPLAWATQPYVFAGNNPLRNVDPSGQRFYDPNDPATAAAMNQQMGQLYRAAQTAIKQVAGKYAGKPCDECTAIEDRALIVEALEHQKLVNDVFATVFTIGIDAGTFVADAMIWLDSGDAVALAGVAADALGVVGDLYQLGIAIANLTGNAGLKEQLQGFAGPLDFIAGAAHAFAFVGTLFRLWDPFGNLLKGVEEKVAKELKSTIRELVLRAVAHFAAGGGYLVLSSNDQIDLEEEQLASESLDQLRQQCQTSGISGCQ